MSKCKARASSASSEPKAARGQEQRAGRGRERAPLRLEEPERGGRRAEGRPDSVWPDSHPTAHARYTPESQGRPGSRTAFRASTQNPRVVPSSVALGDNRGRGSRCPGPLPQCETHGPSVPEQAEHLPKKTQSSEELDRTQSLSTQ